MLYLPGESSVTENDSACCCRIARSFAKTGANADDAGGVLAIALTLLLARDLADATAASTAITTSNRYLVPGVRFDRRGVRSLGPYRARKAAGILVKVDRAR